MSRTRIHQVMAFTVAACLGFALAAYAGPGQLNDRNAGDRCYGKVCRVATGSAATPSLSLVADSNTGLYSAGADNLGVTTGGAASLTFRSVAGYLSSPAFNSNLMLTETASSIGTINGTLSCNTNACNVNAPQGYTWTGVAVTSLPASGVGVAQSLQADTSDTRLWYRRTNTNLNTPWVDFGGAPHPVLERRLYTLDVGTESNSTPTFWVAPRVGATTASLTVTEAATGTSTLGAAPNLYDFRTSSTSAVGGNIATVISTAFAKRNRSVRWCQRASIATLTNSRAWIGLTSALPGATDTNSAANHVSFRYTNGVDTNWQACSSDGTTQTCTDSTKAPGNGTTYSVLCIDCRESAACTYWVDGVAVVRKTTNLPAAGTNMGLYWSIETSTAAIRSLLVTSATVEHN